jgi:hypothetical protein
MSAKFNVLIRESDGKYWVRIETSKKHTTAASSSSLQYYRTIVLAADHALAG